MHIPMTMLRTLIGHLQDSLLGHTQFRKLWLSAVFAEFGARFLVVALPMLAIARLQGGAMELGMMIACSAGAFAVASLAAGVWADRHSPRKLLMAGQLALALVLLSMPLADWLGMLSLVWLYVAEAIIGCCLAIFLAAGQVYSVQLAGKLRAVEANSLFFGSDSLANLIGPATAGLLVAASSPSVAIAFDGVCLLIAFVMLVQNPDPGPLAGAAPRSSFMHDFVEGWKSLLRNRVVRILSLVCALFQVLFQGHLVLQVLWATQLLGLKPATFGMALTIGALGGLIAALFTAVAVRHVTPERLLCWAMAAMGLIWLGFACLPRSPYILFLFVPLIIVFDTAYTAFCILFVSTRQLATPDALQGRVIATSRFLGYAVSPLGGLLFGAMGARFGTQWTYATIGAGAVILSMLLTRMLRGGIAYPGATQVSA